MSRRPAVAFFILFLIASVDLVFAETTEVLATGPDRQAGIPYLSANVITYLHVSYRPAGREGEAANQAPLGAGIQVLYTESSVVPYSSWKSASCREKTFLTVQGSPPVYFYEAPAGWSVFVVFPPGYRNPCSFVSAFVKRFEYFLGITRNSALSSFPAVLKVP